MGEIKSFNIKINEILLFYNDLINDVDEDFEMNADVVKHLNKIQKQEKSEEEAENKEDKVNNEEDSVSDFGYESEDSENNQTNTKKEQNKSN